MMYYSVSILNSNIIMDTDKAIDLTNQLTTEINSLNTY